MRLYVQPSFSVKKGPVAPVNSDVSSDIKTVNFINGLRRIQKTGSAGIAKRILLGSTSVQKTRYEKMEVNIRKILKLNGAANEALYQARKREFSGLIDKFNNDKFQYTNVIEALEKGVSPRTV